MPIKQKKNRFVSLREKKREKGRIICFAIDKHLIVWVNPPATMVCTYYRGVLTHLVGMTSRQTESDNGVIF